MNLKIAGFDSEIDFNNFINVIEIEDKNLYRSFLSKLNDAINNKDETEEILLYENDKMLNINKNMSIYFDMFNIDFNSRSIITELYSKIDEFVKLDKTVNDKYNLVTQQITDYIRDIINEMPFEYEMTDEIIVRDILKTLLIKIDVDKYIKLEEKIMFLIDVITEFDLSKVLIFVNMKTYFNCDKIEEIYKHAICKDVRLLLIENNICNDKIKYETKLYIDSDFDDFSEQYMI